MNPRHPACSTCNSSGQIPSEYGGFDRACPECNQTKTKTKTMDIIGKTIANVTQMHKPEFDDEGWLKLDFTDGTSCVICATYARFTGDSEDEYPTRIYIEETIEGLVPIQS